MLVHEPLESVHEQRSQDHEHAMAVLHFQEREAVRCGSLSGPSGFAGLKVRAWVCADCGTAQDRDVNAALNTLMLGARSALGTEIARSEDRTGGVRYSFVGRSSSHTE